MGGDLCGNWGYIWDGESGGVGRVLWQIRRGGREGCGVEKLGSMRKVYGTVLCMRYWVQVVLEGSAVFCRWECGLWKPGVFFDECLFAMFVQSCVRTEK